jgi:hypothetical protein
MIFTTSLLFKTLHPGGVRTRIECSLGGCDDHCAKPTGHFHNYRKVMNQIQKIPMGWTPYWATFARNKAQFFTKASGHPVKHSKNGP